ncbi:NAD(P)-binding domain-containing protein [Demequina capsici]|uniref:NAD(P)-binding domain-containing protein n=1 Tax=Demequina capsici TaxID=3075620 RepID=A0AA96FAA7_9MICO|nr:NAD(P)-binding domain-containing protein [Demequina sp. PMTSA13]WNM26469.1 NAD(P)-binding domain-containing protein [Demequina sp. PMTSA13]
MTTLGIIGAGNIGFNVAKAAIAADYDVVIANSRGPATLAATVAELGEGARPATAQEAAEASDLILVAVPLGKVDSLPAKELAGKIVMDAGNYYPQRDGRIAELDANQATTAELTQRALPHSTVVKAFNHINAKDIPAHGKPAGDPARRALGIAGDDHAAKAVVVSFLDAIGFDAVDLGALAESWRIERDTPTYGVPVTRSELEQILPGVERVTQG